MALTVKKSILILTSNPAAMVQSTTFLMNRDWAVKVTSDEKDALNLLAESLPGFLMISVEHENRKVRTLHRLLKQTFPELNVIYFAEKNSMETYRLLLHTEHPYRIQPPVTGPAIERAANRFAKEAKQRKLQEEVYMKSIRRSLGNVDMNFEWNNGSVALRDSVLEKGVSRVLDNVLNKGDGVIRERILGPTTNTACIVVESARFSGYLIAAMGGDRPFDDMFIQLVRTRLTQYLRDSGENVSDGESFPLKIRQVKFEAWALDYAEFLRKTVHQGQEIAFAFFPVSDVTPLIGESKIADMCTISVDDLVGDSVMEFNVHLFLPANQKFLLYTPKDCVFQAAQKDRLKKGGIKEMHIRSADLQAFKSYRTRHKLDRLISEFESRSPQNASA